MDRVVSVQEQEELEQKRQSTNRLDTTIDQPLSRNKRALRRRQFVEAVTYVSQLSAHNSLYGGRHLGPLAEYLKKPYEPQTGTDSFPHHVDTPGFKQFFYLYELGPTAPLHATCFNNVEEFESSFLNPSVPKVIFMRGLPSPEWLSAIGAKLHVSSEFFRRHLEFDEGPQRQFVGPTLPSANRSMARLRLTTIGYAMSGLRVASSVDAVRRESASIMDTYRDHLEHRFRCNAGDSIIRELSIHDLDHFTIEQDITIYISPKKEGWTVLVWLDLGGNLRTPLSRWMEPRPPVLSEYIACLPVAQSKPGVLPTSPDQQRRARQFENPERNVHIHQSGSWLPFNYGQSLDHNLMIKYSFYALHEIFSFVASSENQFLNMLESKIVSELDALTLVEQKDPTLSNLLYHQQVLDRHIQRIRENIAFISRFTPATDHNGPENPTAIYSKEILCDNEHLLLKAINLAERCNRGMQVVMNNATIKESRKAIMQAEGIVILTRLAFFLLPLNYVTSIFGMNFAQFGQGSLSIWIWLVVSVPVFVMSVVLVRSDVIEFISRFYRRRISQIYNLLP
ncbi:hypothetical protein FQN57_007349 [Myotisia sp. PD_48]|nr:hypothetical protein FQN57_007349 [Myotisia sp. PD_48]